MTRVTYAGHEPLTFGDYIDLETGKTLCAEPGRTYDLAPASGRAVPGIPAPWFTAADDNRPAAVNVPRARTKPAAQPAPGKEPAES